MEFVDEIVSWFSQPTNRIFLWVVVGVLGLIVVLSIASFLMRFVKLKSHSGFPTDTREANLLALGLQQVMASGNYWNDPTASSLDKDGIEALQEMWGLYSADDVIDTVGRLVNDRRRRGHWQQLLQIRA